MGRSGNSRRDDEEPLSEALYNFAEDGGGGDATTRTKGTKQPPRCRDAWAAILFYAHFIAIAVFAIMWGVPAVQKANATTDDDAAGSAGSQSNEDSSLSPASSPPESSSSSDFDSMGLLYVSMIAGGCSFVFSALSLMVMSLCPKVLIQIFVLLSLVCSGLIAVGSFFFGSIAGGIFGVIFFLLSVCYACLVWRRIPFAAANLATGLTAVKTNAGVFLVAMSIVAVSFAYCVLWMTALVGVYDKLSDCVSTTSADDVTTTVCTEDNVGWAYLFLVLLAFFWTEQVFQNTIHVVIAGVVSTWWFAPEEAGSFCSVAIKDSLIRATTTSFGSICFGSLLVAIIETLRALVESAKSDSNEERGLCGSFLLCLVDCLLRCLEDLLEYFNKFAYIYVGMYGYSYLEAGKNVMILFKEKGWSIIISDNLISNVLSLFCFIIGGLTGCVGLVMNEINPSWFEGYGDAAMIVAFGFSFLAGIVISAILLSVVDSSVNTVLVCFAEAPSEFQANHERLSYEMRAAWRKVYPDDCGF